MYPINLGIRFLNKFHVHILQYALAIFIWRAGARNRIWSKTFFNRDSRRFDQFDFLSNWVNACPILQSLTLIINGHIRHPLMLPKRSLIIIVNIHLIAIDLLTVIAISQAISKLLSNRDNCWVHFFPDSNCCHFIFFVTCIIDRIAT